MQRCHPASKNSRRRDIFLVPQVFNSSLGSIQANPKAVADLAKSYGTDMVIITGMYRFDYSSEEDVLNLARKLNKADQALQKEGVQLLYHNHNCELQHINDSQTAYDLIIENTDPAYVNFEFDSYWIANGGDPIQSLQVSGQYMDKAFR